MRGSRPLHSVYTPASVPRPTVARPYLRPQLALYGASATIILLLIVGSLAAAWLWQVKDWGIETSDNGVVLSVQAETAAARTGVVPGDSVPLTDLEVIRTLAGRVAAGTQQTVLVAHDGQMRPVTLEAREGSVAQQIELGATTWVGIGFVLLGIAPLIARRRTFALWMLFLTDITTGLFLIAEGPRPFHLFWAEAAAFTTVTIFPAVVFHFHTLFPRRQLGRRHDLVVRAVYVLAGILTLINLYALTHIELDRNALWTLILRLYLVGCLGASFVMMVASYRAHEPRVREQIRIIALCGGSGLLANVVLLGVAAVLSAEVRRALENLGVLAAMATPFGYAFAMLRYNVLIEGLIWRRWLIRAVITSLLLLGGLGLAFVAAGERIRTVDTIVVLGLVSVGCAVLFGIVQVLVSQWVEDRLLQGSSPVDLLDDATRQLTHFQQLAEYGDFFTTVLPARLKSTGGLLFLTDQPDAVLRLVACSPIFRQHPAHQPTLATTGDLGQLLAAAPEPLRLTTLLTSQAFAPPSADTSFLRTLQAAQVEVLLPLVTGQQAHLIGLVALGGKETDEAYSAQELATLAALARTAATTAENVLLFEQLQEQLAIVSEYSRRANTAQEEERKVIARDLHDTTLQELGVLTRSLTGLREQTEAILLRCEELTLEVEAGAVIVGEDTALSTMLGELQMKLGLLLGEDTQLAATAPEMGVGSEHQPNIEALIAQVQSTARHVRTVCDNLRPTYLNDPLTLTLQATVQKTQADHPAVVVTLDCQGEEPPAIPDEVKIACTQIVRQAVDNALAHAAPTQIRVALQYRPDETIALTIRDNGRGFVPRPRREWRTGSHHGLANMHERAELVGGELQVLSAPGQGTSITVHISPHSTPIVPALSSSDDAARPGNLRTFSTNDE